MIKTYCGKTCEQCFKKQVNECIGCTCDSENGKEGKGKSNNCIVARCCDEKKHSSCWKCGERELCINYHSVRTEHAPMMARWISVLFWLIIPSVIGSVLTSASVVDTVPKMQIVGMIISITAAVIYAVILMKISSANITYRNAGICRIIVQVLSVISLFWGAESVIYTVISIIVAVVGLIAEYNEMNAHSEVLVDVNDYLTEKWLTLWYWNIAAIAAIICGLVIMFIIPGLAALLVLGGGIIYVVASILKLTYLYLMAKVFKRII